jgi:hypothetical protein
VRCLAVIEMKSPGPRKTLGKLSLVTT